MKKFLALTIIPITFFIIISFLYLSPSSSKIPIGFFSSEIESPNDWLKDDQIKVFPDMVVINQDDVILSSFADTNSMDPLIDETSHGLEIKPQKNQLKVGDIISYRSNLLKGTVIHRITKIDQDHQGTYFLTQGDNNQINDPEKVRFHQIEGVLIGILY